MGFQRVTLNRRQLMMLGLVPVAAAAVAACGSSSGSDATSTPNLEPTATPEPTATAPATNQIEYLTGSDDLVLRVDLTGGFVPVEFMLTALPPVSVYGDGTIITQGPQIAIFPPPALPNLLAATVTEEGMQLILEEAKSAGLLDGDATYDDLTKYIADANTTVFITNAGGVSTMVSAYALGLGGDLSDFEIEDPETWMKLSDFRDLMFSLPGWLPDDTISAEQGPYEIERLQIITDPIDPTATFETDEGGEMDWPLETPLAEIGEPHLILDRDDMRCFVAEGEDLEELLPLFEQANSLVRWQSDGSEYFLHLRPLLPEEEGCETG